MENSRRKGERRRMIRTGWMVVERGPIAILGRLSQTDVGQNWGMLDKGYDVDYFKIFTLRETTGVTESKKIQESGVPETWRPIFPK